MLKPCGRPAGRRVVHFGRHSKKLDLVSGTEKLLASDTAAYDRHAQVGMDSCMTCNGVVTELCNSACA